MPEVTPQGEQLLLVLTPEEKASLAQGNNLTLWVGGHPPASIAGNSLVPPTFWADDHGDQDFVSRAPVRCRRCNRELTHPDSRRRGIGPICMAKEIWEAPMTVPDKITALEALYREVRETGESQGNIQDMIEALRTGKVPEQALLAAEDPDPPVPPPADEPDDEEDEAWPASPEYPQDPEEGREWVRHVFTEIFPSRLPGYEARQPQIDLAEAIAQSLSTGEQLVSEAGTGTGKSLAYLVPSIWFAKKAGRPVVVTTGTKALQEQIHQKDVPFLQRTLTELPFRAALVKGKGNYLCLSRLDDELKQPTFFGNPELERIRDWSRNTMSGDMAELPYIPPAEVWGQVNVDDTCNKRECPFYGRCFFFEAKRQWAEADILICNHHLFFADLAIRGSSAGGAGILPQYSATVFDEAHHIEPVASDSFGVEITPFKVTSVVKDLRKLRHPDMPEHLLRQLEDANRTVFERPLYVEPPINKVDFRRLPELTQEQLKVELKAVSDLLLQVDEALGDLSWLHSDDKSRDKCQKYRERLLRLEDALQVLIRPEDGYVNWIEVDRPAGKPPKVILHNSPISVAEDLRLAIWDRSWATISTSATISTGGNFRYFRSQVGLDQTSKPVQELLVDSPFDYRTQARLYIPRGLPEPKPENEEAYQAAILPEIRDVLGVTGGRAFLLFTSYKGLAAAYNALADELRAAGMTVMKQGDLPRTQLVQQFKDTHAAGRSPVLFATGTFWEGIDIQGEALSCVIIDKIPFARPDDPVTLAKLDAIKQRGGNEFMEWSVPEAAIKLKQGVGRLIRTRTDKGLVVILDPRLRTKPYGRVFLNSLPPMPEVAWLNEVQAFMKGVN